MNKQTKIAAALILFLGFSSGLRADEGMWLPVSISKILYGEMKEMGLQLTPEQIYDINNASIKDAIVSLGGFCTGEIVSRQGLLLTNHHCAVSSIQSHSSTEHDYLENGFWAQTMEDELPNEGLYARFLVRMEDVTDQALADVEPGMTEENRKRKINGKIRQLQTQATEGTHYDAEVKPIFEGNQFYLFVYETFTDVRLVGAPPTSIGSFGGETDNWVWPRHTGDFALFRVYAGPDGKPAAYSPENIPLNPKHHLPVSLAGYSENDFAMILGFPGSTDRYITSYGLELTMEQTNPHQIKIFDTRQKILREAMRTSDEIRIKYHSKYQRIGNALKYYRGQTLGVEERDVIQNRKDLENRFHAWVEKKNKRKKSYEGVLEAIQQAYDTLSLYQTANVYNRYSGYLVEMIPLAGEFSALTPVLDRADSLVDLSAFTAALKEHTDEFYKDYHAPIDRDVFVDLMNLYRENVTEVLQPDFLQNTDDLQALADSVYDNSIFTSRERLNAFLDQPDKSVLTTDPAYRIAESLFRHQGRIMSLMDKAQTQIDSANRLFVRGLMEMSPDKTFYPDANSTMRFSYGTIRGYTPRDAVIYRHYTSMEGIEAKDTPGDDEFDAPDKLLELYRGEDYGPYDENGVMEVNFTSNHDITGGNSGSPVLNGNGELIGIAFDGNWEAMSSDIEYIPELQRSINVDIRYVLFVIDKFAGAGHLIDEMTLVDENSKILTPTGSNR